MCFSGGGKYLIIKKFISCGVPYITMRVISLIGFLIIGIKVDAWFLLLVFCSYVITLFILRYVKLNYLNIGIIFILFLLCAPQILHWPKLVFLYPFFVMGLYMKKEWDFILKHKRIIFFFSLLLYIISYSLFWNKEMIIDVNGQGWILYYPHFSLSILYLTQHIIRYVVGAFAIAVIVSGVFLIKGNQMLTKISSMGSLSLELYLIGILIDRYHFQFVTLDRFSYALVCVILSIVISFICIVLAKQVRKLPVLDFFIFGKGKYSVTLIDELKK